MVTSPPNDSRNSYLNLARIVDLRHTLTLTRTRVVKKLGRTGHESTRNSDDTKELPSVTHSTAPILDLTHDINITCPYAVAHGGFSDIHRGESKRPLHSASGNSTQVAVKLLRVFTKQEIDLGRSRKRLNREVEVWRRLDHGNIAKFYGVSFQFAGRPALVMQWYDNGTAPHYLESRPFERKFELVQDMSRGLKYLHTINPPIVHGDLKGNNILVDDQGHGVLSDFGLSKVLDDLAGPSGNTTTTIAGSVRWQAPELMFDEDEDEENSSDEPILPLSPSLASDVWSFGSTAYELLTGRLPYEHHLYDWKVIQNIMKGITPLRPDDHVIRESQGLLELLNRCWAPHPSDRPDMGVIEDELGVLRSGVGG